MLKQQFAAGSVLFCHGMVFEMGLTYMSQGHQEVQQDQLDHAYRLNPVGPLGHVHQWDHGHRWHQWHLYQAQPNEASRAQCKLPWKQGISLMALSIEVSSNRSKTGRRKSPTSERTCLMAAKLTHCRNMFQEVYMFWCVG